MKTKRGTVVPYYAVGVLWLLAGAMIPLYSLPHYVVLLAVSAAVFFAVRRIAASADPIGEEKQEKKEPVVTTPTTGDPELDKMIKDGNLAISEMKRLDDNIDDGGVSADIVRLEEISRKIFDEVRRDPKKLPQIRRFMDYYLPTTLKLLNAYDRMSAVGVAGENIDTTLDRVDAMMKTVVAAFEKQLDSLYGAEAMDISADITVLETMMAREGLTGQPMQARTSSGDDEFDIKLEL